MDIRPISNVVQTDLTPTKVTSDNTAGAAVAASAATPVQTPTAVQQPDGQPSTEKLSQAIKEINKTLQSFSVGVEFSMDSDTHETVIKVVDTQTKDVIRQIPSPEVLDIAKALDKIQGLLIREEA